ncbi:serine protease persephone-like [Episyrphus balteatus]|uniref:serine protease persephone-like n=1 Tax=Episyrphus balteatus TaxID=286459 RepID=UPI0024850987|nr:serine protease persephone-like [Episyrphus balteatus]
MVKFLEVSFCFMACILLAVNGMEISEAGLSLEEGASCKTRTGEPGVCKLLTSCREYYEGLKNKTMEYDFMIRCSFINMDEVICCPSFNDNPSELSQLLTDKIATGTPRDSKQANVTEKTQISGIERPSVAACRKYSAEKLGFLILCIPLPVVPGEYPHMGGLIYPVGDGVEYRCSSSLISERYLLTAAHCVTHPGSVPTFVRLGVVMWNITADDEDSDGLTPVDIPIENITIHPLYNVRTQHHDIALIRLNQDVKISAFVQPACLYTDTKDIDSNTNLVVVGWGVTDVITRLRSPVLLQTNMTTVPINKCNSTHIDSYPTKSSFKVGLNEGQYCAYDPKLNKDACDSDSGGPLQLVNNGESTIVGVVSYGISCESKFPSVYTRVAYYLDWIESIVWPAE